jgi:hypothetical protein
LIEDLEEWFRSPKGKKAISTVMGIIGLMATGISLLLIASVFFYNSGQGQPHYFAVIFLLPMVLPVAIGASVFGVCLNRKSWVSWIGTVFSGLLGLIVTGLMFF